MILLLHGTDRLALDERVRTLRGEHDPSGISTTILEQGATQLGDLRSAALAPGFFGTSRVVIVYDLLGEPSRPTGRRARSGDQDQALQLLSEVPDSTVLVVVERAVSSAQLRTVAARVPDIRVERLDVPRGRELVDWARHRASSYGATLETSAATRLLETLFPAGWRAVARRDDVPPDLYRLDAEIAKLSTSAFDGSVTVNLVDEMVSGVESANIWGLTDAIAAGDAEAAVREAERALATGAAPEMLIGQLAAHYETFAALAASGSTGVSTVAAETGITEGRLQQASRSARRFPISRVRRGLAALRAVDVAAKQGEVDAEDRLLGVIADLAADR